MSIDSAEHLFERANISPGGSGGWTRRLLSKRPLERFPISVFRRRLGNVVLALLLLAVGWYGFTTRDAAIRQSAIEFIEEATPGGVEVSVGRATFRMFDGITLHDLTIAVPYDKRLDSKAVTPQDRTIFSAKSLKLVHNPWMLLIGSLRVERVLAVQPTIVLAHNVDTGARNWKSLLDAAKGRTDYDPDRRPAITLRSVEAVVVSIDAAGDRQFKTERLDADVRPHPQAKSGYYIEVRRYSDPVERTTVYFDPGQRMVANTPFVDLGTVRLQLPKVAHELFDDIGLRGEVKLTRLLYDAEKREDLETEISLRGGECRLPFWLLRSKEDRKRLRKSPKVIDRETGRERPGYSDKTENLLTMTNVHGIVKLAENCLYVDVAGLINGASCSVKGQLSEVSRGLDEAGWQFEFDGTDIPTPEGAVRKRMMASEGVPSVVKKYFEDYDPRGNLDFHLEFSRRAGAEHDLSVTGHVSLKHIEATCKWFEYPLKNVTGLLRLEEHAVLLENLIGHHGSGQVVINVVFDRRTEWSDITVDIQASAIPLNLALYAALPGHYQTAWRRFTPRGTANIHALLRRPGATEESPKPEWHKRITIDLVDSQASMAPYPYPLDNVYGRFDVEEDRILIEGLTGTSRSGSVRVDGYAIIKADESPEVELRVEARDMRLDEGFGAALPPEGRGAFDQFQPEGFVDLIGSVSLHDPARGLVWDMRTKVYDTRIRYEHFPYRIDQVGGEIAIRPDRISIINVKGRHDETEITAGGQVERREDGYSADLVLDTRRIGLDDELYRALPPALKDVWQLLDPAGEIRIRTRLYFSSENGRKVERHRTEIEPVDARIRFKGFPLPLTSVTGRVLVTNRKLEILSLRGHYGDGMVELRGEISLAAPGRRGTLILEATGMRFTKELVNAMPKGLRSLFEPMRPKGSFALRLDPLRFVTNEENQTRWEFDGALELKSVDAELGVGVRKARGRIQGRGRIEEKGGLFLDLTADCERAKLSDWHVENLKTRIHTSDDAGQILIEDASADLYGGDATGFAEIDIGPGPMLYQASFTIRDVQLGAYLEKHAGDGDTLGKTEKKRARGTISGSLSLRGRAGKGGYREGAGEVFVTEAQVWKLPIFLAIFQVLNLTPDENVFHDGRLKYYLTGQQLTIQKIDLQGKAMSFVGGGTLDLQSNLLNVTLLAGSPVRINVPLLTDILQGASREIMELRLTGTIAEPIITPQPLKSLKTALETLFPEAPPPIEKRPRPPARE